MPADLVKIRPATSRDATRIVDRLKRELTPEGGFWHNRDLIIKGVRAGELTVITVRGRVAGFLLHGDREMAILEIWSTYRRRGLARRLAQFGMSRIYKAGAERVCIQCTPFSSVPFWKSMGFVPENGDEWCNLLKHTPAEVQTGQP